MSIDKKRIAAEYWFRELDLIQKGAYSAHYFLKLRDILQRDDHNPVVKIQFFQRGDGVLAGMESVKTILSRTIPVHERTKLTVMALEDGDLIGPNETVLTIEGPFQTFAHLESVLLGKLARQTRVATNVRRVADAAQGKPILFMGDRFDDPAAQFGDGYAAILGGAAGICTEAMGVFSGADGKGTMPHALIAAYGGDTVLAAKKYAEMYPDEPATVLVDFDNDCVGTSLAVARELGGKLGAVRLDTSGGMVDDSVQKWRDTVVFSKNLGEGSYGETFVRYRGVCPELVTMVREALDAEGFQHVKIIVSGGFNTDKISKFEAAGIPVDMYGVGSSLIKNGSDFTADIVEVDGKPCAKVGRQTNPNERLKKVEL